MLSELDLAALLCSRVCHDLISPVSALNNGLEVLEEDDDPDMRAHAMNLIVMSGRQASNKLEFARMAYGASGSPSSGLDLEEAGRIMSALFEGSKIRIEWRAPAQVAPKALVKILLNLVIIAGDTIPRGGVLTVRAELAQGGRILSVEAQGEKARLGADTECALMGQNTEQDLDARSIQPFYVHLLSRSCGLTIACMSENDRILLTAAET